ncbi:hypothetical protein GQ53DRAFT_847967 [Thozetella sp. PMI_491]|nr:hypothetical protein GQ53DRAFT_847967 [Thozetella sp. PMI_491]
MAEGFVGLAFGVSGVFSLVDQCLNLYRHIHEAQDFGENVWEQYILFQHECIRFNSWQKEMRDFQTTTRTHRSRTSPQSTFTPNLEAPNADQFMRHILAQIISILEAVKILGSKYKIDQLGTLGQAERLKKADVANISTGLATTVVAAALASDGKSRLPSVTKKQNESTLKGSTGLFKRILYGSKLWKDSDKEEFQQLVTKFAHWNQCLESFLPSTRTMLLDLISSSTLLEGEADPSDLRRIHAAASAGLYESLARRAALRQANLEPRLEISNKKDVTCVREEEISSILSLLRGVATFSDSDTGTEPVKALVEWKSYVDLSDYDEIVEAEQHVEGLVKLLSFGKKPATMAVLDSLGYFQYEDQAHRLFGIISEFPSDSDHGRAPVSLNELLTDGTKHKRLYGLANLSQRIRIAQRLAITLLELHNAEWLHKDLNSWNIIFFYNGSAVTPYFDAPYISGFEYARPDNIGAISFNARSSPMSVYRHPSLLGPFSSGEERPRFQRIHDIYSLGLLLLEIGLWKQVGDFCKSNTKSIDFANTLKRLAEQELPHRMGTIYRDVVLRCIDGHGLCPSNPEQEELEHSEGSTKKDRNTSLVKFYWSVIRELERCHCT